MAPEATNLLAIMKQQQTHSSMVDRTTFLALFLIDIEGCKVVNYNEEYTTCQTSPSLFANL